MSQSGPAFFDNSTQILAEIFRRRPAKEPVAHVKLIYNEARLEDDGMRDHRIVVRIGVFDDVEVFLNDAPWIGQKRPVGADAAPKFIRLSDIVGADCDQPAITNLQLRMKLN